jgi:Holliday junction resolvase
MLEKQIQKKILDYLNARGKAIKIMEANEVGTPDIISVVDGIPYILEVKQPSKSATPIQLYQLQEWSKTGAHVRVVTSVADVETLLHATLQGGRL